MMIYREWTVFMMLSGLIWAVVPVNAQNHLDARPTPFPLPEHFRRVAAPGYCPSSGGSRDYESISNIYLTPNAAGTYEVGVGIVIADPTGCGGKSCPVYERSLEYLNVWIDWNGDQVWETTEQVIDTTLTEYPNTSFNQSMNIRVQTAISEGVQVTDEPVWLRATLGWGYDPQDPCQATWTWGDVVDQIVHITPPKRGSGRLLPDYVHIPSESIPEMRIFAQLVGLYADEGIDTDGDGLYNYLKLSVNALVHEPGVYTVTAWLQDQAGSDIAWAATRESLTSGLHTLDLLFDGVMLHEHGIDGSYTISRVEIPLEHGFAGDEVDNPYTTAPYHHTDFDPPLATFLGTFSDTAVDTDGDGLYDMLRIHADLDIHEAGTYTIQGALAGSTTSIFVAYTTVWLLPGRQQVELEIPGRNIFQTRQDGPYHLRRLRVKDTSGSPTDYLDDAYQTTAYIYDQFQHDDMFIITGSFREQGVDVNSDGKFEYLRVTFRVYTSQGGSYRVRAQLADNDERGPRTIDTQRQSFDLPARSSSLITLDFSGSKIARSGKDGPYQICRVSLSGPGFTHDYLQQGLVSQAYRSTDFLR